MDQSSTISPKSLGGRSVIQISAIDDPAKNQIAAFSNENVENLVAVVECPSNGWKTLTLTFRARNSEYADRIWQPFISASSQTIVSARYGLIAGEESQWRAWEDYVIIAVKFTPSPDRTSGPLCTIKMVDRLWLLLDQRKIAAYVGPVSSVVSTLWKSVGGINSVIEETVLEGHNSKTGTWYQSGQDSWSFLRHIVQPFSLNRDGIGGYRANVKDNELHFHTPTYGSPNTYRVKYSTGEPGFSKATVTDRFMELAGGSSASGRKQLTYDPLTGKFEVYTSNPEKLLKLAESRPSYSGYDISGSHVGHNRSSVEAAYNHNQFSAYSSEGFMATLEVDKCMDIRVGDFIDLALSSQNADSPLFSGVWLVNHAIYTMDRGGFRAMTYLTRGEWRIPSSKKILDPNEYNSDGSAAGLDASAVLTQNSNNGSSSQSIRVSIQRPA